MNQILTDEEIGSIQPMDKSFPVWRKNFARAIEQAVLNKLSEQEPSVPEGYQLVPIEPTEVMIAAGRQLGDVSYGDIYKAMLSAARSE